MHRQLTAACLFSGMGGFSEALKQADIKVLWGNEIDAAACKTYRHNHKARMIEGCVSKLSVERDQLEPVDILTAGFPCQSFSRAGLKNGFNDERGRFFYHIPRLLREFGENRPAVVILENVPNLWNGGEGMWLDEVVREMQEADYWFTEINCKILNTADVTGIPQNRPRLFMVALSMSAFAGNSYRFPEEEVECASAEDFIDRKKKPSADHYLHEDNRYYKMINRAMGGNGAKGFYQLRRHYTRNNEKRCPALTANMGSGGHNVPFVKDRWGIRKLTVSECLGLQGFSKNYKFPDEISQGRRYQQIGNSVTVPLAKEIIMNAKECFQFEVSRT